MAWLIRRLSVPVSEPKIALVLALCAVAMGLLSVALVWQAQVIADQRETIQWLKDIKLGM
jgi:hypothetical protein